MEPISKASLESIKEAFETASQDDRVTPREIETILNTVKDSPHSQDDIQTIIATLFDATKTKIEDPKVKKALQCLKQVTTSIIQQSFTKKPEIMDVLFFPNEANEKKLKGYLESAKRELLICVYTISNDHLSKALLNIHKKGIKIRIITDDACCENRGSDILELSKAGIPVKIDTDKEANMHHKFVVIDGRILINGSFNWTYTAVKRNNENLAVLDNLELSKIYIQEFEKLWKEFPTYNF